MSWPAEPLFDQLEGGADAYSDVRFEALRVRPRTPRTVTLRVGEDFDLVVMGMSVASLPDVTKEIAATDPRFQAMLDHAETVATQALQVWMTDDAREARPDQPAGHGLRRLRQAAGHVVRHVAPARPRGLGRRPACRSPRSATSAGRWPSRRVRRPGRGRPARLRRRRQPPQGPLLVLWPGAEHRRRASTGRCSTTTRTPTARTASARSTGARTSSAPSATCSRRPARSSTACARRRPRPPTWRFAGDWTRNGVCGGSVEAAVTSGKLAAQHLSGHPAVDPRNRGLAGIRLTHRQPRTPT